jgi:hypothetical protein
VAQVERAVVVGNVTDKSGAAMAGVEIAVTNESTNTSLRVLSDEAGAYSVPNLIPGSYTITASKPGFRQAVFRGFVLQVSQTARLDISLELGNVEQTIEVTGAIPLLQTETPPLAR